jgi:hypothetical protein
VKACDGKLRGSDPRPSGSEPCFLLQLRPPKETATLQPDLMSRRHPLVVDLSFQSALERSNETESHVTLPVLSLSAVRRRLRTDYSKSESYFRLALRFLVFFAVFFAFFAFLAMLPSV